MEDVPVVEGLKVTRLEPTPKTSFSNRPRETNVYSHFSQPYPARQLTCYLPSVLDRECLLNYNTLDVSEYTYMYPSDEHLVLLPMRAIMDGQRHFHGDFCRPYERNMHQGVACLTAVVSGICSICQLNYGAKSLVLGVSPVYWTIPKSTWKVAIVCSWRTDGYTNYVPDLYNRRQIATPTNLVHISLFSITCTHIPGQAAHPPRLYSVTRV